MKEIEIKDKKGSLLYVHADTRQGDCVTIPESRLKHHWRVSGKKYLKINNRKCSLMYSTIKSNFKKSYGITVWIQDEPTIIKIGGPEKAAETSFYKFCKSGDWGKFMVGIIGQYNYGRHDAFSRHMLRKLKQLTINRDCDNCPSKFICWTRK